MTLDEAIKHCREVADVKRQSAKNWKRWAGIKTSQRHEAECLKCAEEHEQLAEWLEELKKIQGKKCRGTENV